MKRVLLPILVIGVLLLGACGAPSPTPATQAEPQTQLVHYVNEQFGYSIDYPKGWIFEEINPNEIGLRPKDSEYNQIQIHASAGEPVLGSLSESQIASLNEAWLQQFFDVMGASNLNIFINEPASGKWDWVVAFTVIYEETPLQGTGVMKEANSILYNLSLIQSYDWPEGQEVIDSFEILGQAEVLPSPIEIESYLDHVATIIDEATELALEISSLYETAAQLDSSEVIQKCVIYAKEYDDLLSRFIALEYPQECYKLREYVIDSISYSRQEVTEFGAYFATGNIEHLYESESYYNDAQRSIALAAGEMYRLEKYQK